MDSLKPARKVDEMATPKSQDAWNLPTPAPQDDIVQVISDSGTDLSPKDDTEILDIPSRAKPAPPERKIKSPPLTANAKPDTDTDSDYNSSEAPKRVDSAEPSGMPPQTSSPPTSNLELTTDLSSSEAPPLVSLPGDFADQRSARILPMESMKGLIFENVTVGHSMTNFLISCQAGTNITVRQSHIMGDSINIFGDPSPEQIKAILAERKGDGR